MPNSLDNIEITDDMIRTALYARVPGGSDVWHWLPQADGWNPHETARVVMRSALEAVLKPLQQNDWQPIESAPTDGSHFLIALGGTFGYLDGKALPSMQAVVHYFLDPDEPGFYLSSGLVSGSYNDHPQKGTHWKPLDSPV